MDTKKILKQLMLERDTNINAMAEHLEILPQSLRNKINRGNFSLSDFVEMLDFLNCELQIVTRDTGKIFK